MQSSRDSFDYGSYLNLRFQLASSNCAKILIDFKDNSMVKISMDLFSRAMELAQDYSSGMCYLNWLNIIHMAMISILVCPLRSR